MSKAVLISIRPEWCEKIASGQKTIEVRKMRPKINAPFKCYIYESHGDKEYYKTFHEKTIRKVIGEFVCDNIGLYKYGGAFSEKRMCFSLRVCSGLSIDELKKYACGKDVYGWHISDLVIYDKPKELSDFYKPCPLNRRCTDCIYGFPWGASLENISCNYFHLNKIGKLTRPPQSWCYVEELI